MSRWREEQKTAMSRLREEQKTAAYSDEQKSANHAA
jgi:hypothetical protein